MQTEILNPKPAMNPKPSAEAVFGAGSDLLRTLIDNLPDCIFIKDTESRIVLDNAAHARTLGATGPGQVIGTTDFDWFPEEMAAQYYADEQALLKSGQQLNREEAAQDQRNGETLWLQ